MSEGNNITNTDESANSDVDEKARISLYEFYALGIERLIVKAPWELERSVSVYHDRFLTEQRCMALAILLLLGENHVPIDAAQSMPGFEAQARFSVNQAVFRRALKHYFESSKLNPIRADMVIERMGSYISDSRHAEENNSDPLEAMFATLTKRVPPRDESEAEQYASRVENIFEYVSGLVEGSLLKRYEIIS
jgi:hypothetical protein